MEFLYKNIWIFKTSFEKFDCRTFWISWEINKKLKTVDFFIMWLFILGIEILNFYICQKPTFAWSGLEQVSSGWINSNFCEGKVSIWRCLILLTFSGLHFFYFIWPPWIFNRGLSNPQWTRNSQNASLCSRVSLIWNFLKFSKSMILFLKFWLKIFRKRPLWL